MNIGRAIDTLTRQAVKTRRIDPVRENLSDYDLVSIFSSHQGSFRIIKPAKASGLLPATPSQYESLPSEVLDGLGAERPVVMTDTHTMYLEPTGDCAAQASHAAPCAIRSPVLHMGNTIPPAGRCPDVARSLNRARVADQLHQTCYRLLSGRRGRRGNTSARFPQPRFILRGEANRRRY